MSSVPQHPSRAELAAAGRRKLEEYRRKKAAAAAASSQAPLGISKASGDVLREHINPDDAGSSAASSSVSHGTGTGILPADAPSSTGFRTAPLPPAFTSDPAPVSAFSPAVHATPQPVGAGAGSTPGSAAGTPAAPPGAPPSLSSSSFTPAQPAINTPWLPAGGPPITSANAPAPVDPPPPAAIAATSAATAVRGPVPPTASSAPPADAVPPHSTLAALPAAQDAAQAPSNAGASSEEGSREGQQAQQQAHRRLPPPIPKLFDWRSLGRPQAAPSPASEPVARPEAHQHHEQQQQQQGLHAEREERSWGMTGATTAGGDAGTGIAQAASAAGPADLGDLQVVASGAAAPDAGAAIGAEVGGGSTQGGGAVQPGTGPAAGDLGDLGAAFAAFVDEEAEEGEGDARPAGGRGGLFATLFTRKGRLGGGERATEGQRAQQREAGVHEQGLEAAGAAGQVPAKEQSPGSGVASPAGPSSSSAWSAQPQPSSSAVAPAGGLAGGYGALSDSYLAPAGGQPQHQPSLPPPSASPPATAPALGFAGGGGGSRGSLASGYALLSDGYAGGGVEGFAGGGKEMGGGAGHEPSVRAGAAKDPEGGAGLAGAAGLPGASTARSSGSVASLTTEASRPGGGAVPGSTVMAGGGTERPAGSLPPGSRNASGQSLSRLAAPQSSQSRGADFRALQQHIDELTEEKFTLHRGLEQQSRLAGQLADENEMLSQRFNEQARQVDSLQREVAQLQQRLEGQAAAVDRALAERDAYKLSAQESQSRAQSLAAEVVRLEEAALKLRSQELRVGREAEGATEVMRSMQSQLEVLSQERSGLLTQLHALREEGAELRSKLRQAEAATAAAAAAATCEPAQQLPAEDGSGETASLLGAAAAPQLVAAGAGPGSVPGTAQEREGYDGRGVAPASLDAQAEVEAMSKPPLLRSVSGAVARAALAAQYAPGRSAGSEGKGRDSDSGEEEGLLEGLLPTELQALLPASLSAQGAELAGAGPADVAASEEVTSLVQSIYLMLTALEVDRQHLVASLNSKQDEVSTLQGANRQLAQRLEGTQQRLELLSQQQLQGAAQHAVGNGAVGGVWGGDESRNGRVKGSAGGAAPRGKVARRPGLQYLS